MQKAEVLHFADVAWAAKVVRPRRTGFSLVELLIVIGIIAALVGIILPTIAKARESAFRVHCASNLRQCGMAERMYANENGGWLFLRLGNHAASIDELTQLNGGCMSVPITKYASASVFFCPAIRSTALPTGWDEADKRFWAGFHHIGYGVFGAFWNNGLRAPDASSPWWGMPDVIQGGQYKITHLRPGQVRMSEWMVSNPLNSGPNNKPLVFHHGKKYAKLSSGMPRPDGGNMLMGDGSVQWSSGLFRYYGGEIYTIPEMYSNWP